MNDPAEVMIHLLQMSKHKIEYVIRIPSLVEGLWGNINRYGIKHTKENHDLLVEIVQDILNGPDIEREWSEEEYNNFVAFKGEE